MVEEMQKIKSNTLSEAAQTQFEKKAEQAKISDLPASEIMSKDLISIKMDTSIRETIGLLKEHHISGIPVVDEKYYLYGIVTEYDLLIQAATHNLDDQVSFKKKVTSIRENTTLKEILVLLFKNRIKRVPVVDEKNTLLGVVSRVDVLNKLAEGS